MPAVEPFQQPSQDLYDLADLFRMRRAALRTARSLPIGPERNQQRQIALSLKDLVGNDHWVRAHVRRDRSAHAWRSIETAPYSLPLELAVIDDEGPHALVFPCRRIVGGWTDVAGDTRVLIRPTHWREWWGLT
jgi:hypothetical protein